MTYGRIVTIVMPRLIRLREWPGYRGVGSTASRADTRPNNAYYGSHQLRWLPCKARFGRTYGLGVSIVALSLVTSWEEIDTSEGNAGRLRTQKLPL